MTIDEVMAGILNALTTRLLILKKFLLPVFYQTYQNPAYHISHLSGKSNRSFTVL
jgi:hypothetical protein